MKNQFPSRKSWSSRFISLAVIVSILLSSYSMYRVLTLKPGESIRIPPGVTVEKPEKRFGSIYYNDKGELIVVYTDDSTFNAGRPQNSPPPTVPVPSVSPSLVQQAVQEFCSDGRCNGERPTMDQVASAVSQFCADDRCKGDEGDRGADAVITEQMLAAAIANYCSNDRCRGATGNTGGTGAQGRSMHIACILVTENNTDVRYYSAKYTDQENTAYLTWQYRSRLPTWFLPNDCIDMRA